MSRKFFGPGLRGEIAERIQHALLTAGLDPKGTDGIYGRDTAAAVTLFQGMNGLTVSGDVDSETWQKLIGTPPPGIELRCLCLTAAIEGHGYTLAVGNFDGAWLTWGIIGFTLKHGEVQKIILEIQQTASALLHEAFGESATDLLDMVRSPAEEQEAWAIRNTVGQRLAEPWRSGFARLGASPQVQEIQRKAAVRNFFEPATRTAQQFDLRSELGVALCFDIRVQNGGVKNAARQLIEAELRKHPPASELERREVIGNAVADVAKPKWRDDVRRRKLAIARGAGLVHGLNLKLENYGLSEAPVI